MLQQSLEAVVIPQFLSVKQDNTRNSMNILLLIVTRVFADTTPPVVFSCGNEAGHISENPTATLDDGE